MATDQEILDVGSQELVWHHHSLSTCGVVVMYDNYCGFLWLFVCNI